MTRPPAVEHLMSDPGVATAITGTERKEITDYIKGLEYRLKTETFKEKELDNNLLNAEKGLADIEKYGL